jgi:hypothetical protein
MVNTTFILKKLYMLEKSINDTCKQLFTKYLFFPWKRCKWSLNVNTKVAKRCRGGGESGGYSFWLQLKSQNTLKKKSAYDYNEEKL